MLDVASAFLRAVAVLGWSAWGFVNDAMTARVDVRDNVTHGGAVEIMSDRPCCRLRPISSEQRARNWTGNEYVQEVKGEKTVRADGKREAPLVQADF